jgi:hypothetical protein
MQQVLYILIILLVAGGFLYVVRQLPIEEIIKTIIYVVVLVAILIYLFYHLSAIRL